MQIQVEEEIKSGTLCGANESFEENYEDWYNEMHMLGEYFDAEYADYASSLDPDMYLDYK